MSLRKACFYRHRASVAHLKSAISGKLHFRDTCGLFSVACLSPASAAACDELRGQDTSVPNLKSAISGELHFRATSSLFSVACLSPASAAECDEFRGQDTSNRSHTNEHAGSFVPAAPAALQSRRPHKGQRPASPCINPRSGAKSTIPPLNGEKSLRSQLSLMPLR
jgi:hypothetical protein